jgi:hypothetical protein
MILLVFFLVFTPLLLTPWIHGTDGVGYFVYLRSSIIDHDLNFTDEYAHYSRIFPYIWYAHDQATGLIINQYLVGTAVLWAPFFLFGHIVAVLLGYPADGYSAPYLIATCFGSSVYGFLAIVLAYRFSKRFFSPQASLLSALGIWFASSLPYYMWLDPSMSHSVSAFLVSAFLYTTCVWSPRRSYLKWAFAGFLLGLLGITRPADLGFVVIPILFNFSKCKDWLHEEVHRYTTSFRNLIAFAAFLFLALLPQLMAWRVLYGTFVPSTVELTSLSGTWTPATLTLLPRVFLSPLHGLFYWTPITALGVLGAALMIRDAKLRMLGVGIITAILIQAVLVNGWSAWYAPASFGQRFFLNCTAPLVLGLASFDKEVQAKIKSGLLNYAVVLFLILWNLGLLIQYGTGIISPDEPESLITVAYNDLFVVLPQLLVILTKFFTTRMGHAQLSIAPLE